MESSVIVFTRERLFMLFVFVRESSFIVFTQENWLCFSNLHVRCIRVELLLYYFYTYIFIFYYVFPV